MSFNKPLIRNLVASLCTLTFCVCTSTHCQAELIIDVQDASLTSGSLGFVDVFIRSDGTDFLNSASYVFQIQKISGDGSLEFQASTGAPSPSQSNSEQSLSNYVFFPVTVSVNYLVNRLDPDLTRAAGGDFITPDVMLNSIDRLLVRLELQHTTPTPLTSFSEYRVFFANDPVNEFLNSIDVDPVGINAASFSNFGTITISPTAVPEPSSFALVGCISAVGFIVRNRFNKQSRSRGTNT